LINLAKRYPKQFSNRTHREHCEEFHGTYIGPNTKLSGERAILAEMPVLLEPSGYVGAQFDNTATGMGHGWYRFKRSDWAIEPNVPWPWPPLNP
jgi:hypothetical protein